MPELMDKMRGNLRAWRPYWWMSAIVAGICLLVLVLLLDHIQGNSFYALVDMPNNMGVFVAVLVTVLIFLVLQSGVRQYLSAKQAQLAFRRSEERWRSLVENAHNYITIVDRHYHIQFINRTVPGLDKAQVIGQSVFDYVEPEYHDIVREKITKVFDSGESDFYDSTAAGPNGEVAWYESYVGPIKQNEEVVAVTLIASDITERTRTQEALARRMAQLTALGQAAQIITASLHLDQVLAEIVSLTSELTASDSTSIVLMDAEGQVHQSIDNLPNMPPLEERIRDEGLTHWIVRSRFPVIIDDIGDDGSIVPDLGQGAPRYANPHVVKEGVKSVAGLPLLVREKILGVIILHNHTPKAFHDQLSILQAFANQAAIAVENARLYEAAQQEIVERSRVEEALRHQAFLLENVSEAILSGDLDFNIIQWNCAAEEIYGWTLEEVRGKSFQEVIKPDYSPFKRQEVVEEFFANGHWVGVVVHHRRDGTPLHVSTIVSLLRDEQGNPIGVAAANRDISEQVRAENALKESHMSLSQTVAELQETQKKLVQQERLAAVGQLAAGIAHDFNNVMASIILYSDLMLNVSNLTQDDRDKIQSIRQQGQHAAELIQQILDFSRKAVLQRQYVELNSFLNEMRSLLKRTMPESIRIHFEFYPEELFIFADSTRLQQAMMNLAINARDALLPQGGGNLWVEVTTVHGAERPVISADMESKSEDWVRITVRDDGVGIPDDVLPHIFEPFFTTKAPLGSGLGLAQVYGIVTQHQGTIEVESQPEVGSSFAIFMPIVTDPPSQLSRDGGSALAVGHNETILVVEDEPAVRDALEKSLITLNYRPISAANGQEALRLYRQHQNDIAMVLSDLVMPEMGGMELASLLKAEHPTMRMVVLTGYGLPSDDERLVAAGVVGWLQKPIDLGALSEIISQALK